MPGPITDLPVGERPRERLRSLGVRALSDAELLALLIGSGCSGKSAVELARDLLAREGSLHDIASMRLEDVEAVTGLKGARAPSILAAFELGRRVQSPPIPTTNLRTQADLGALAVNELGGLNHERLIAIVLNRQRRVLRVVTIAEGWSDRAPVPVREVIHAVLRNGGSAFALAHNHPSGDPTPSTSDFEATEAIAKAAAAASTKLLDHLVVGGCEWTAVERV